MKKLLLLILALAAILPAWAHYYVPRFDPNQDEVSNVADLSDMIDALLSGSSEGLNCDITRDGRFTVSDISYMIDYLLNPEAFDRPEFEPVYPDFALPERAEIYEVNGVRFAMVPIDTVDEAGNLVHKFSLGVTEVTIELWQSLMGNNPSEGNIYEFVSGRWPVSNVNWYQAYEFISKLNELTGLEFRLPTTSEWKFAGHGGLLSHNYWCAGSDNVDDVAWTYENLPPGFHDGMGGCPVGLKAPNELGLYDMNGNVSEWCQDGYRPDYAFLMGGDVGCESHTMRVEFYYYDLKGNCSGEGVHINRSYYGFRLAM